MATTQMKVKVKALSKYGFFAEGFEKGLSFSKYLPEADKTKVVPGAEFEIELYTGPQGGLSVNKILSNVITKPEEDKNTTSVVKTTETKAKTFNPKFQKKDESTTMSKSEWQAKDRSQLIGGLSHDAATIAAVLCNVNSLTEVEALNSYKTLLEGMLKIREEVK